MESEKLSVNQILEAIKMLTPQELLDFNKRYAKLNDSKESLDAYVEDLRFANGRICPLCGSKNVVRNGKRSDGVQMFRCKDCSKAFTAKTNSIAASTHKDFNVWLEYIECMMNWATVRDSAKQCGISLRTSFVWRHKILDALQNMVDEIILEGIVEADETYFALSYKGNHKNSKDFSMPRDSRKRGGEVHKRGLSDELVCVPCAVDRNGQSVARISNIGECSTKDIHKTLDGKIKPESSLCTDGNKLYRKFSKKNDLELVPIKGGKATKGIYHIQHINSYHSELKRFLSNFKGVSTKYLNNYIVWNNLVNFAKETYQEKAALFLDFVLTTNITVKFEEVQNRPPIPE